MGTDITIYAEHYNKERLAWESIPRKEKWEYRSYLLYKILANSSSWRTPFAVNYISTPRGIPKDSCFIDKNCDVPSYYEALQLNSPFDELFDVSWLTLKEIEVFAENNPIIEIPDTEMYECGTFPSPLMFFLEKFTDEIYTYGSENVRIIFGFN